jgi:hypothetical protein
MGTLTSLASLKAYVFSAESTPNIKSHLAACAATCLVALGSHTGRNMYIATNADVIAHRERRSATDTTDICKHIIRCSDTSHTGRNI